jgi:hypothetical protein
MQVPQAERVRKLDDNRPIRSNWQGPMNVTPEDNPGAECLLFFRDAAIET